MNASQDILSSFRTIIGRKKENCQMDKINFLNNLNQVMGDVGEENVSTSNWTKMFKYILYDKAKFLEETKYVYF